MTAFSNDASSFNSCRLHLFPPRSKLFLERMDFSSSLNLLEVWERERERWLHTVKLCVLCGRSSSREKEGNRDRLTGFYNHGSMTITKLAEVEGTKRESDKFPQQAIVA